MCLCSNPHQLGPSAFRLSKPKNCTRMTGIESHGWRPFRDVGLKRVDGTEMAGWGIAADSPDNFVRILCGPVSWDPHHPAFLGATSCSNNTAQLTGFCRSPAMDRTLFIPRGEQVRILYDSKHAERVALGVAYANRNSALAHKCNGMVLRSKNHVFHLHSPCFFDTRATLGMSALILLLLLA